jgi:hypothetical protein
MKEGIIGKLPWEQTRIELGLGVGEGENNLEGEKTRDDFPPLMQQGGARSTPTSSWFHTSRVPEGATSSQKTNFQGQIDKFIGYFRKKKPQSYAQAVRFESQTARMVYPGANRTGGQRAAAVPEDMTMVRGARRRADLSGSGPDEDKRDNLVKNGGKMDLLLKEVIVRKGPIKRRKGRSGTKRDGTRISSMR